MRLKRIISSSTFLKRKTIKKNKHTLGVRTRLVIIIITRQQTKYDDFHTVSVSHPRRVPKFSDKTFARSLAILIYTVFGIIRILYTIVRRLLNFE